MDTPPCGKGYAEVFQGLSAFCTPDGTHTGEEKTDRENTWSGAINIPAGAARTITESGMTDP
jgi:hypothetical protein